MNPKTCVECSNKFNCKEYLIPECKNRVACLCPVCVRNCIKFITIRGSSPHPIKERLKILARTYYQCYYKSDYDPILEEIRKCYITWKI